MSGSARKDAAQSTPEAGPAAALRLHAPIEDATPEAACRPGEERVDGSEVDRARDLLRFDRRAPRLRLVDAVEAEPEAASAPDIGAKIAARVAEAVGPARFDRYFAGQAAVEVSGLEVRVVASTPSLAALLDRRFGPAFREAAGVELGADGGVVRVSFASDTTRGQVATSSQGDAAASTPRADARSAAARPAPASAPNIREYRLEDFVIGDSNRLAYNAVAAMAEGSSTQPASAGASMLFLHGPCGVGKTHLLQGLARRFREIQPGAAVRTITGEAFMNEFVHAIKNGGGAAMTGNARAASPGGIERFRRQYRKCDLLCIDDVHFLASKQATQQELLHTFDEISLGGARIALVCDRHPRAIRQFSPALVSRFMAGMVAAIEAPDAAVRERAIRLFAQRRGLVLEEAAVRVLVERTRSVSPEAGMGIRDIEGLMTRIDAIHRLLGGATPATPATPTTVGVLVVERALGDAHGGLAQADSPSRLRKPVRIESIIAQTCTALGVDSADLGAATRHKRVVLARAAITHLARQFTTLSYPEIARAVGRPSHSTVITAHQRLQKQLEAGEAYGIGPEGEAMTVAGLLKDLSATLARA